jgi:serine/threonine protein kinase
MLMGTTAYCAPEQLQGLDLDGRADQYALGCTAFNLLTGSAPFHSSNPAVIITQHLSAPPPPISLRRPELAELDGALAKALAKSPNDRYPTCADFAAALGNQLNTTAARFAGPTEVIARPTEVIAAPPNTPAPKPRGSRRTAIAVAAVLAAALVGLAAVVGVRLVGEDANQSGSNATSPSAVRPTDQTSAPSKPAIKLSSRLTDQSRVLGPLESDTVNRAINKLSNQRGTKLWVVYVKNFGGLKPLRWAEDTMHANGFTDTDALLAIATDEPAFSFRVPNAVAGSAPIDVEMIRRDRIGPAVFHREWARAAIVAADGLDVARS